MTTGAWDPWNFRDRSYVERADEGLVGFSVYATDGDIGKVDEATTDVGGSYIVIDTGRGSSDAR